MKPLMNPQQMYSYNLGNFAALCILIITYRNQAVGEISSWDEIQGIAGQNAIFMFNTTNGSRILGAKFGLDGGRDNPYPKLITIIYKEGKPSSVICSFALDKIIAARYKHRVFFIGNLARGHAWFVITNLSLSDTNQYRVLIREVSDDKYRQRKSVRLTVKQKASTPTSKLSAASKNNKQTMSPPTSQKSEPRYTAFKGIAEKENSTEENPKVLLNAIQAAFNSISNIYTIRIMSFKLRKKKKMLQAKFRISFTKAINQTYAHSFLHVAEQNNKLEGYKITCFDVLRRQNPRKTKRRKIGKNPSTTSPGMIVFYVLLAMVTAILIIFAILYKCFFDLVEPYIQLLADIANRVGLKISTRVMVDAAA